MIPGPGPFSLDAERICPTCQVTWARAGDPVCWSCGETTHALVGYVYRPGGGVQHL